jgi:hypothetical protein
MNGGNKPTFALRPIPYYVGLFRKRGKRRYMVAYYQNRPHSHLAWHMSFIHNLYPSSATPLLAFLTTVIMTNVIYTIHTYITFSSFFLLLSLSLYSVNSHFLLRHGFTETLCFNFFFSFSFSHFFIFLFSVGRSSREDGGDWGGGDSCLPGTTSNAPYSSFRRYMLHPTRHLPIHKRFNYSSLGSSYG